MPTTQELETEIKRIVGTIVAKDEKDQVTIGDLIKAQIMLERENCCKLICGYCRDPLGIAAARDQEGRWFHRYNMRDIVECRAWQIREAGKDDPK